MARVTERNRNASRVDDLLVSGGVHGIAPNPFGTVYYVDGTNGSDSNTGKDPTDAFATIEAADAVASAFDTIVIAPGTYTVAAASSPITPVANLHYKAAVPPMGGKPTVIWTGADSGSLTELVEVNVDNVIFEGILFQADDANLAQLINLADTANCAGIKFIDCWFDANALATVDGIAAEDASFVASGVVVKGCRFLEGCVSGIEVGVLGLPDWVIEDNVFRMNGGEDAITMADVTAFSVGAGFVIRRNIFIGPEDGGGDAEGIVIAGGDDIALGAIFQNFFVDLATTITQDQHDENVGQNWVGGTTGAAVVDPTA